MKVYLLIVAFVLLCYGYDNKSVYQKNNYGYEEKVGEYRTEYNGNKSYYQKNNYGYYEKKREYRTEWNGDIGIYEKNSYGYYEKIGTIKK